MTRRAAVRRSLVLGFVALSLLAAPPAGGRAARAGAPAQQDGGLTYVAMGDSFTSGPLVLPHDTTWVPEDCGQSVANYPHVAAELVGATSFVDVSCGSATIDKLYEPQDGLPLGGVNAPQLDALHSDVDVVTLGMSGNDVGYVGLALSCVRLVGPPVEEACTPAYTPAGRDYIAEEIAEVGPELGQAIRDIQAAAPDAVVLVVGYPTSLPDSGTACWPYVPILAVDMPYLVAKYKEMNAMLAEQAAANGARYVDTYTPSIGHDACQLPPVAWVNGLVVVPPSLVAHPNQLGLAASGHVVAAAIQEELAARAAAEPPEVVADGSPTTASEPRAPGVPRTLPATGDARSLLPGLLLLVSALAVGGLRSADAQPPTCPVPRHRPAPARAGGLRRRRRRR